MKKPVMLLLTLASLSLFASEEAKISAYMRAVDANDASLIHKVKRETISLEYAQTKIKWLVGDFAKAKSSGVLTELQYDIDELLDEVRLAGHKEQEKILISLERDVDIKQMKISKQEFSNF